MSSAEEWEALLRQARVNATNNVNTLKFNRRLQASVMESDDRRIYASANEITTAYNDNFIIDAYSAMEATPVGEGRSITAAATRLEWGKDIVKQSSNSFNQTVLLQSGKRWFDFDGHPDVNEIALRFVPIEPRFHDRNLLFRDDTAPFATIRRVPSLSGAELIEADKDKGTSGGQVLCIRGSGLRGALKCDMLFVPPLFEYADYQYISTFPLTNDEVSIRLRDSNARLLGASGPLTVFAIDTGGGLLTLGESDGVILIENVDAVMAPIEEGAFALTAAPNINIFDSTRSQKSYLALFEIKSKVEQFCQGLLSSKNSFFASAASVQMPSLHEVLSGIKNAQAKLLLEPLARAAVCQVRAKHDFAVRHQSFCTSMREELNKNIAIIQHFLHHAATLGIDYVFIASSYCFDPTYGFIVTYDDGTILTFESCKLRDRSSGLLPSEALALISEHYMTNEMIWGLLNMLRNPAKAPLLALAKATLVEAGYHVGNTDNYPIIVSLWGHESPQALPMDTVAQDTALLTKWYDMRLHAPPGVDHATIRLLSKPLGYKGNDSNNLVMRDRGTRDEEGQVANEVLRVKKDAMEDTDAESRPHTEARSVQTSPYSPPPRTQPTSPGSSGSSSKKNKKKGRRGVLYSIRRLINFRKQEQPSSK